MSQMSESKADGDALSQGPRAEVEDLDLNESTTKSTVREQHGELRWLPARLQPLPAYEPGKGQSCHFLGFTCKQKGELSEPSSSAIVDWRAHISGLVGSKAAASGAENQERGVTSKCGPAADQSRSHTNAEALVLHFPMRRPSQRAPFGKAPGDRVPLYT